jgi:hypothetical protein
MMSIFGTLSIFRAQSPQWLWSLPSSEQFVLGSDSKNLWYNVVLTLTHVFDLVIQTPVLTYHPQLPVQYSMLSRHKPLITDYRLRRLVISAKPVSEKLDLIL